MSDFQRCPTCRIYAWMSEHRCPPIWECKPEWQDDEYWAEVYAIDSETAAEKYAERYDCDGGEYAIVSGRMRGEVIIQVRKPGDEETEERWAIEAEAVPTYRATRVTRQERS